MTLIGILLLISSTIPAWIITPPRRPMSNFVFWLHVVGFLVLFGAGAAILRVE